jgi:hypothetical protein
LRRTLIFEPFMPVLIGFRSDHVRAL